MSTANDHYRESERLLKFCAFDTADAACESRDDERDADFLRAAQVHATLALAAAHNAHIVDAEILPAPNRLPTTGPTQGEEITDQMGGPPRIIGGTPAGCDQGDPWCSKDSPCHAHASTAASDELPDGSLTCGHPDPNRFDNDCVRDLHDDPVHVDAEGREFR